MAEGRLVYLSGDFVPESEARVSIFDTALMFGDMVFEMTRSYNMEPFRLRHHLERLYAGIKILEIDCGLGIDEMEAATMETIEINKDRMPEGVDYQIMHNVSNGPLGLYSSVFPDGIKPTISINVWPLTWHLAGIADFYDTGVHSILTQQQSVPARYIDPKIKNRSRVFYQVANLQAHKIDPKAYALLSDEDGFITEGTGNNFFMVRDGQVITPKGHNILRGVSRGACMELAGKLGLPLCEADIEPYDVRLADEAWFTSTTICMVPITRFNFQAVGDGQVGPVYRRLLAAWSEAVGVDIAGQARQYAEMMEGWIP
jgi:branched-chain amino acid aminotransferase